ncbi:hypothetical protein JYT72_03180 [Crocinitomix catalasitica]|nr:hypothetical protein [Crocinitomix catalasitica]
MNKKIFIFLFFGFCLFAFTQRRQSQYIPPIDFEKTGIYLDSLENEVLLHYSYGKPDYYYSNIFTPVCETGVCKPIYINIYWDLMGNYHHFDQPKGEILTKLDHQPFTDEDYQLLDEILRGDDPRYGLTVKHSSLSESATASNKKEKHEKHESEGSPAPTASRTVFMSKMEMVDGITGATLPQLRDQFVPGALYTTYTCWDLANTRRVRMGSYTRNKLFTPKNYDYFFGRDQRVCRDALIEKISNANGEENAYANTLMSIADSANEELAMYCIQMVYYYDVALDTVQTVCKKRFEGLGSANLKREIIYKLSSGLIRSQTLSELAKNMVAFPDLHYDLVYLFQNQGFWPKGVVGDLCRQIQIIDDKDKQQALYNIIEPRRATMTNNEWSMLRYAKKKFGL